jgi:hypothetical protein
VKIWGYFVPVDFVVLDMETMKESPLILGQPFLSMLKALVWFSIIDETYGLILELSV